MERFGASLAHYRLPLLVPALLAQGAWSGRVVVERGPERREFWVTQGSVAGLSSTLPGEHLGQALADFGLLSAAEAAAAFEDARRAGVQVGSWLVQRGRVTPSQLTAAVGWRIRVALLESYRWESGDVEVVPGEPLAPEPSLAGEGPVQFETTLPLEALHADTLRFLPAWTRLRERFARLGAPLRLLPHDPGLLNPPDASLLGLVREGAPLRQVLTAAASTPGPAASRVLSLEARGILEGTAAEPEDDAAPDLAGWVADARRELDRGSFSEAERLLQRVLRAGPVPEASALYRQVAEAQARSLSGTLARILPRLRFHAFPSSAPPMVKAADLVVLSRLRGSANLELAAESLPMGPRALLHSLRRLAEAGLVAAAA